MTEIKPERRWFRFSLRTLFVVVTILCFWLAREIGWHKDRQEMLTISHEVRQVTPHVFITMVTFGDAPWHLRLFGDRGCGYIQLTANEDAKLPEQNQAIAKVQALFPESQVRLTVR